MRVGRSSAALECGSAGSAEAAERRLMSSRPLKAEPRLLHRKERSGAGNGARRSLHQGTVPRASRIRSGRHVGRAAPRASRRRPERTRLSVCRRRPPGRMPRAGLWDFEVRVAERLTGASAVDRPGERCSRPPSRRRPGAAAAAVRAGAGRRRAQGAPRRQRAPHARGGRARPGDRGQASATGAAAAEASVVLSTWPTWLRPRRHEPATARGWCAAGAWPTAWAAPG